MRWQYRLFSDLEAGRFPTDIELATGLGKTSIIALWVLALGRTLTRCTNVVPRRLAYVVDRRVVVDQASEFAEQVRERLEQAASDSSHALHALATKLKSAGCTPMVQVAKELTSSEWKSLSAARHYADRDSTKVARLEARLRARRLELVEPSVRQAIAGQDARLVAVEVGSGGPIAGVHIAPHYRASGYLGETPKLHLRVTFDRAVAGPLAVGRGRHVGFGVLWPADSSR